MKGEFCSYSCNAYSEVCVCVCVCSSGVVFSFNLMFYKIFMCLCGLTLYPSVQYTNSVTPCNSILFDNLIAPQLGT